MCGIVGYIGNNAVAEELINGLKNLEYRGYDSAGVALNDNKNIDIFKAKGKLCNLCDVLNLHQKDLQNSTGGIGHIRWATHGSPTVENAHPHCSADGKLVLVHNGIIENYKELREELVKEGFAFVSQTDTETAVHLIDRAYRQTHSLEEAVLNAVKRLKGAFAFCIMHKDEPDKIIAVRKNAPLIVGLGDNENFIASDIPAVIGKVKKIIYLDDAEMAIVSKNKVEIKNFNGQLLDKKAELISFSAETISKRGYKHFMLKEICEQPDIIRNILAQRMSDVNNQIQLPQVNWNEILKKSKVEIIACGTSLHAAMVAKYFMEDLLGIPVHVEAASEYIYRKTVTDENTLTIGISQSGETADTITAVKQAQDKNAHILILTNRPDSSIVRYADSLIPLEAGIEVSVAATKSYTAQLISLYLLTLAWAERKESLTVRLQKLKQELLEIPAKLEEILSNENCIKKCSELFQKYKSFIYISRGINLPTAMEGALKLKEISYINASGYAAGELKHGPIALLDENMPVLAVLIPGTPTYDKILSNCEEAKARQAHLIAVTSAHDEHLNTIFDEIIQIPFSDEVFSPMLESVPLRLLAYHIADNLGREVDQPRNLAKSVTVE